MTFDKTIVVVGASRGIGAELVKKFAQHANFQVIALSRSIDKMKTAFEGLTNVSCYPLDLEGQNVRANCETIFSELPRIDILINNAGKLVNKEFDQLSFDEITSSYQVNIVSVMQTVQAALPKMDKAHIVNISSMGGFQGSVKFAGLSAYSTSKAALCSFTELFAEEYKDSNISMNCLCLGAVQTEMLEEAFPGYEAPLSPSQMADFIEDFALNGNKYLRGKIIPVSLSTP